MSEEEKPYFKTMRRHLGYLTEAVELVNEKFGYAERPIEVAQLLVWPIILDEFAAELGWQIGKALAENVSGPANLSEVEKGLQSIAEMIDLAAPNGALHKIAKAIDPNSAYER